MTRLQKLLAAAGLGSRRGIEQWIREGRVSVSGRTAQLGDRATPTDEVCLDGRRLDLSAAYESHREVLLYHKPLGEVTTRSDPQGRPTVFERLPVPHQGRWITVGRLDVNTSGLLLLTTDGELAHRLMHPSSEIQREYLVRVRGNPPAAVIGQLLAGVVLEDGSARFDSIEPQQPGRVLRSPAGRSAAQRRIRRGTAEGYAEDADVPGSHTAFRVVLHEGRNREVRRLWNAVGFEVSRLRRTRYGPIHLPPDLPPGRWRLADGALIARLVQAAGASIERAAGPMTADKSDPLAAKRSTRSGPSR